MATMSSNQLSFNRSQAIIHLVNANVCHNLWPRGNGKTEGGAGPRVLHLAKKMPRSQIIFYSDKYDRIEGVLIPNVMDFLKERMKLREEEDYVVFKKPPSNWIKPLREPKKYDRVVSFKSGMALCCAASSVDGSANGYNAQAAIIDECKYVPENKIKSQLYKALRGQFHLFGHLPEYRSVWSFTDKYEGNIDWILKLREKQNDKLIGAVLSMALEVNRLNQENMNPAISDSTIYRNKQRIFQLEAKLTKIRKDLVFVCDAKPFENVQILGKKFYRDARRDCETLYEFNVAVLNHDPDQVVNTFYPARNPKKHYYSIDHDTTEEQSLCVAMDYQWRITPMVIGQWGMLPNMPDLTFNVVNGVHTLHPDGGIEKTVKTFCEYYNHRHDKTIYYLYDHTAVGRRPDGACFKDIAVNTWLANGWNVIECPMGQAPEHNLKHEEIKSLMQDDRIRFHEHRAKDVLTSIKHAGATTSGGKTKKIKTGEKNLSRDPVKQTDYSDAFDQLVWGVVKMGLVSS